MVLLTLLGLTAFILRERREVKNTSGQDETVDQSDVLPMGSTDGQTSQHITSDPEFPPTEEEPTSPPKIDDDGSFPFSAESEYRVAIPQASDNPTEDTVAHQSSQLEDNEKTIIDINAIGSEEGIGTVLSGICLDDGLQEGYSEPLQLELQHKHSEDKERDGASDNETKSDSGVPEVPIPANDTPEVLNKVLSGLSSRLKNCWERYLWEILTPAMISFFFFIIIVNLGPMALMMMTMMCFLIKCCHQIIKTGSRVYHCYQYMPWFRILSLYFLLCVSYFFYGETITDYFFPLLQREESVHMLRKYHHLVFSALYLVWICMVVLSLVKKHYRLPFCMFVWTLVWEPVDYSDSL